MNNNSPYDRDQVLNEVIGIKPRKKNNADISSRIFDNDILEREIPTDADAWYEQHQSEIREKSAKIAATVRQLEQDSWDRYYAEYGYPEKPDVSQSGADMERLHSMSRIRKMIG